MRAEWLCDTNIISELMRPRPDESVVSRLADQDQLALSTITLEEIRYGLAHKDARKQIAWFDRFLDARCQVFPVTPEIARRAGDLRGQFRARGIQRTQADMIIAATALLHDLVLVTRNIHDFEHCQVRLLNPFPS